MQDTLLVELLTEELPPKALERLSQVLVTHWPGIFARTIADGNQRRDGVCDAPPSCGFHLGRSGRGRRTSR